MKTLKCLMIRGSDIDVIPESVIKLDKLKTFRIEDCPFDKVPDWFYKMHHLKYLGFRDTKIKCLNPGLFPKNLKQLHLDGTRFYETADFEDLKTALKGTKVY
ncbi:leucine-rich repeat domain-containing protein [Flavobacterium noncentrifugens]|uniref:leucine-rich repeat domain-containing protein n=1 Tax=Flavobacterium noncentrifugens TaxID=1128970 RepID=UPI001113F701|nr:leucine-rich repeat domain-containing protein [Flavobacterium noncentrifugens]